MKAVVKTKKALGIELLDVDVPVIGETDILVKVEAASLCGSDLHYYEWVPGSQFLPVPVILGHEFSGRVVETGALVETLKKGDRVSAMPSMPCGACNACRTGRSGSCKNRLIPGLYSDGFFAEYARLTAPANIFKLPDNVSYECAALLEPFCVSLNAVDISDFKIGQTAAVLGPGPIGLLTMQILKASGVGSIMMVGTSADSKRLELAARLGADVIVVADDQDPAEAARVLDRGGVDFVFEATGNPKTISLGLDMIKRAGKLVLIGIHSDPAEIDPTPMVRAAKMIISAYGYSVQQWQRAIRLMSNGIVKPEQIITHRLPLEKAQEGFDLAISKEAVKVIFLP